MKLIVNITIPSPFWHFFLEYSVYVCLSSINVSGFCLPSPRFSSISSKVSTIVDPYSLQTFINITRLSNIELQIPLYILTKLSDTATAHVYTDCIHYTRRSLYPRRS